MHAQESDMNVEADSGYSPEMETESSPEEEGVTSSSDDIYPIVSPPSTRELPPRSTRGRRLSGLLDTEEDSLFWEHETWKEEENDEEWGTEDEGHYRDKFDSDFLSCSSHDSDDIKGGTAVDTELRKEEKKAKKKFDYEKIAKRREQRKLKSRRVWSVFDLEKIYMEEKKQLGYGIKGGKKGTARPLFQKDHLRVAAATEELNKSILSQIRDELEVKKYRQGQVASTDTLRTTGEIEAWVSWTSDRKIEHEESKKSEAQKLRELEEPRKERQLLFFINIGHPTDSKIPDIYNQVAPEARKNHFCSIFPSKVANYRDPLTKKFYSNAEAFKIIRHEAMESDLIRVSDLMTKTLSCAGLRPDTVT